MILVAEVMQSEQRYVESENLLQMALKSDPRNPTTLMLLGRALTTRGSYGDAEKMLKRSLEVSSNGFRPNSLLASLYARQGKYELAENALIQAIRWVPSNEKRLLAQQFELVGDGYLKAGKRRNAERSYQRAKSLDPENETLSTKLSRTFGG
jgi:cytochrome c-type biogenesis protein CcmH/NrfG